MVREEEEILVTDRGDVVAELRNLGRTPSAIRTPTLLIHAREGRLRLRKPRRPEPYGPQPRIAPDGSAGHLLDEETGER